MISTEFTPASASTVITRFSAFWDLTAVTTQGEHWLTASTYNKELAWRY